LEEVETASSAPPLAEPPSGNGTILLVEDEEMVRNLARRILERQGYRVLAAAQAEEVAALIEHNGPKHRSAADGYDAAGMNGKQLYGDLHRDFPICG
jgi:CheY-like chemotaxis protein